ncbi:hypothetical protein UR09_00520 [Candidatus Nitromaritima sp. SCGC AAA799-A02]|nr:hypothetical protein UR09_00520 [Candidatus Nitromaritima sp. SCGC AAA799-A02]
MITINLHDYRLELKKVATQQVVVRAVFIIILAIAFIIAYWGYQNLLLEKAQAEVTELEKEVSKMEPEVKTVDAMKQRSKRASEIMTGINELRVKQFSITRVLEDLTLSIPDEIWLTEVRQMTMENIFKNKVPVIFIGNPKELNPKKKKTKKKKKKGDTEPLEFLEVKGRVFGQYGDQILAEYVEQLRRIPYFKQVFLQQTRYQIEGSYPVRDFKLYTYMPTKTKPKK